MGLSPTLLSRIGIACVIGALSMLPFLPVLNNGFVWDDALNVMENPLVKEIDVPHLKAMFTERHAGHYTPLTWLSIALNHASTEAGSARDYLVTNLILHGLNAALVFLLLMRLLPHRESGLREVWAALGTLLYAVHPLRAESVAWVSERRDVLSLFFLLLCLVFWLRSQRRVPGRNWWYAAALVAFAASLLSKAWGVTFPVILLLLMWRPIRHQCWGRGLVALIPFFALAIACGWAAIWAQSEVAMASLGAHGIDSRIIQALWAPSFYLWQTAVPIALSPLYLLKHDFDPWTWPYLLGAAVTLLITLVLLLRVRRQPGVLVGWLIFLVVLAPVSGLMQSGSQLAADRYTYLAGIVLAYGLAYLGHMFSTRIPISTSSCEWAALALVGFSGWLAFDQTRVWESDLTLWTHAVEIDDGNYVAYFNRATVGYPYHKYAERLADLERAIELDPNYTKAYAARGELLLNMGEADLALPDLERAIASDPLAPQPYVNRGKLRMEKGDENGALSDFHFALQLDAEIFGAYVNRALLYQRNGEHELALKDYESALALDTSRWEPYYNRGLLYKQLQAAELARDDFTRVTVLNPDMLEAWEELVRLDLAEQDYKLATKHVERVLLLLPEDSPKRAAVEELYAQLLISSP